MKAGAKDQFVMAALGFALGVAVTIGWARMPRRHHKPSPDVLVQKFTRQLGLSADQQKSVRAILEDSSAKLNALHEETESRLKQITTAMRADIRKDLDPDQQKRFDQMAARWDSRHKKEEQ